MLKLALCGKFRSRRGTLRPFRRGAAKGARRVGFALREFDIMWRGFVALKETADAARLIKACRMLRFWDRETKVDADA